MARFVTCVCALAILSLVCFARNQAKQQAQSGKELYRILDRSGYGEWLDQDVVYIIKPEERSAFLRLQSNEERRQFVAQFWQQRNPDPTALRNRFEQEHYRRIMYANEYYSAGILGWKTDRGRIYIIYGAPSKVESATLDRADCQFFVDAGTSTFRAEIWHYFGVQSADGTQHDAAFRFGDPTNTGDYFLCFNPQVDALTFSWTMNAQPVMQGIESYSDAFKTPPADIKQLEQIANSRTQHKDLKFDYRFDFIRCTSDTTLVPITIQIPRTQMNFEQKDGVARATMYVFGRVTTLTGRVVAEFADPIEVDVPENQISRANRVQQTYQEPVLLSPGLYALDLIVEDRNSGRLTSIETRLPVREFAEHTLDVSSLILARPIFPFGATTGLSGFILGGLTVVSRTGQSFAQAEGMGFFLQIYNLRTEESTNRSHVSVQYRITPAEDRSPTAAATANVPTPSMEDEISANELKGNGVETTVAKNVDLNSLAPGRYRLEVIVSDNLSGQTIKPSADFTVVPVSTP